MVYRLVSIIIVITATLNSQGEEFTITPLHKNPGIYSDRWGSLRPYRTSWNLITHVDLAKFLKKKYDFTQQWFNLKDECQLLKDKCRVSNMLTNMQETLHALAKDQQDIEDLVYEYSDAHSYRKKRTPLGFIGSFSRTLFGTLDASDAEFYNNKIEEFENDTRSIIELIANQSHIVKSQFNERHGHIDNLSKTFIDKVNNISHVTSTMSHEMITLDILDSLTDAAATLELTIAQYELDTAILTDAIIFAKQGQLHPRLLSPLQLLQGARAVQRERPNSEFPFPLKIESTPELVKLSDVKIYHLKGKLIYVVSVPLLTLESYTVYKNIPIPILQHSSSRVTNFAFIKPTSEFTAIADDLKTYFRLDIEDLHRCRNFGERFICKHVNVLYRVDDHSDCEVKILTEPRFGNFASCDIRVKNSIRTYWSRIHTSNRWIFSCARPETLRIKCHETEPHVITINGTGVLHLESRCEASTSSAVLVSTDEISTIALLNFAPRTLLNVSNIYAAAMNSTDFANITEILTDLESPTNFDPEGIEGPNIVDSGIKLQVVINRAQDLLKHKKAQQRIHQLETTGTYSVISMGSLLLFLGLAWNFSLFSKLGLITRMCRKKQRRITNIQQPKRTSIEIAELAVTPPTHMTAIESDVIGDASARCPRRAVSFAPATHDGHRDASHYPPAVTHRSTRHPRTTYSQRLNSTTFYYSPS